MQKELWQDLNDQQAERLSAGQTIKRLQEEFSAELATLRVVKAARQPEAEGKIRGTLLLGLN